MVDEYEVMGEFHDLFMRDAWERLRPALVGAFGRLGPGDAVLDLGAGSGVGTRLLSEVCAAQVVAVEPSLVHRAILTARVADDARLSRQVTVLEGRVPEAIRDPAVARRRYAGFVCAHMLGHLSSADRVATFEAVGGVLAPGAVGLVTVAPDAGLDQAATYDDLTEERALGELRYVARYVPEGDAGAYTSVYEVYDGDRLLRTERVTGSFEAVDAARLEAELPGTGLSVADRPVTGVVLVRKD
ncbi:class I SAM-dependent methyltransferase [Antribacter gilvus]|uniref:class I SAM-dependent methyltransferase n=1 Tax=Antribacter gilvus TaxID=2304675 RepID=UPI000F79A75D|nr:class I SAM-dependent methyltransferase [Antribacter gilvus]